MDAGVVGGVAAEREPQVEVSDLTPLPNQKRVAGGDVLWRGLAVNDALPHAPEPWVAIPAVEIRPIEEFLHVGRLGWRDHGGLLAAGLA